MNVDDQSPPGAWRREWDSQSHTVNEYREKIRELRERNRMYVETIYELNKVIEDLQEELSLVQKYIYRSERREE